jgi:hypothetical protein
VGLCMDVSKIVVIFVESHFIMINVPCVLHEDLKNKQNLLLNHNYISILCCMNNIQDPI